MYKVACILPFQPRCFNLYPITKGKEYEYKTDILQSRPLGAPTLQDFKIEDTTLEEIQSGRCYLKGYTIQ
jgi:hypothetical protein